MKEEFYSDETDEIIPPKKSVLFTYYFALILFGAAFGYFFITWIFLGIKLIIALICLLVTVKLAIDSVKIRKLRKKASLPRLITKVLSAAIVVSFMNAIPHGFKSASAWRYSYQIRHVQNIRANGYAECFPDKLPENISDYSLRYLPSFAQGAGHFSVCFTAPNEYISECMNKYSKSALKCSALTENTGDITKADDIPFYKNSSFWEGFESSATVFIISTNDNFNHPKCSAVIIDKGNGRIEFSQLG